MGSLFIKSINKVSSLWTETSWWIIVVEYHLMEDNFRVFIINSTSPLTSLLLKHEIKKSKKENKKQSLFLSVPGWYTISLT